MIGRFRRDDFMSPQELSEATGVAVKTLANWRSDRKGPPFFKVGRKVWYPTDCVGRWAEKRIVKTT